MAGSRTIFQHILDEAKDRGLDPRTRSARMWLRERAADVPEVSEESLIDDLEHKLHSIPAIGGMYLFKYDPKYRDKLPYYDTFPLIIPVEFTSNGFHGINLHYLPHMHRASLMDRLYEFNTDPQLNPNARIALSYAALSGLSTMAAFRPCYKRYLFSQVQSRYLKIDPLEWEIALFLPLERFEKASSTRIYNDSLAHIKRHRKRLF